MFHCVPSKSLLNKGQFANHINSTRQFPNTSNVLNGRIELLALSWSARSDYPELPEPPTTTLASTVNAPVPELKAVIGPLKNFVLGLAESDTVTN